jgi:hypothetical protein
MIRCTECQAPVDWNDQTCWHCQASLRQHPLHNDIRYLIAYGRVSRFLFNFTLILGFLLLLAGTILSPLSRSFFETIVTIVCVGVPVFIAFLRLSL